MSDVQDYSHIAWNERFIVNQLKELVYLIQTGPHGISGHRFPHNLNACHSQVSTYVPPRDQN